MTFKQHWEKSEVHHTLPEGLIEGIVEHVCPFKKLLSQKLISGGCANLNIKIHLEGDEAPLLVRLYLRDKDATYREQNLGCLLKETIPLPQVYHVGDYRGYRFALINFIEGIPLRNLLLSKEHHEMGTLMNTVGELLGKISHHTFPASGFFDKDLTISEPFSSKNLLTEFVQKCLQNQHVISQINPEIRLKITSCFDSYSSFLPDPHDKNLVHGDFDPANILVSKSGEDWSVTGILDWEFSFSGSTLWDVANMLRYAHEMPPLFEEAFLNGLKKTGIFLPLHWRRTISLLNLSSLLDSLVRANPEKSPIQCADIRRLITFYLNRLESSK